MASAPYRTKNRQVLAKIESTSGTDASPAAGTDDVLFESPQTTPELGSVTTNEVTGSLDAAPSLAAGGTRPFGGSALLKGSGTAATAPEWSPFLQACSMSETVTSSAVTGTAQAGASSTITLASGASSSNGAYVGMRIATTGGTGSGQERLIIGYVGSSKVATVDRAWATTPDATTVYSIAANVQFRPGSILKTATIYHYHHHQDGANSKLEKLIGAAGNAVINLSVRDACRLQFQMRSKLTAAADGSRPAAPDYDDTRAPPWLDAPTYLNGVQIAAASISVDLGASVQMIDDPNEAYGYGAAGVTERRIRGELLLPKDTESTLNILSSWQASTPYALSTYWGSVAGNKLALALPACIFSNFSEVDRDGYSYWRSTFEPLSDAVVKLALTTQ
jgi:hypothetical protein